MIWFCRLSIVFLLLTASAHVLAEDDWPAWRGGPKQGVSSAESGPLSWSQNENIRWRTEIPGRGNSSPIVAKGRVYVTTAHLTNLGAKRKFLLSVTRQALLVLTIVCCAGLVTRVSETSNSRIEGYAEFAANTAVGVSLFLIGCFEIFGESTLDYEQSQIRAWLGSGITVALCIAVMAYRLHSRSISLALIGIAAVGFGVGIVAGIPSWDHVFHSGFLARKASVVLSVALLPIAFGISCIGNFLLTNFCPNRKRFAAFFHLFVAAVVVVWGILFFHQLWRTSSESTESAVSAIFTFLCVAAMLILGSIFFSWGLLGQESGPWRSRKYHHIMIHSTAIVAMLASGTVLLWYLVQYSPYLTYHLAKPDWVPQLEWFTPLGIATGFFIPLAVALLFRYFFPSHVISVGRVFVGLFAIFVFVDTNYVSSVQPLARAIVCIDAESGELLWIANALNKPKGAMHRDNSPATPTAAVGNERIYAVFGPGVFCCNSDGVIQWTNEDITFESVYGLGASPALSDSILVISHMMLERGYVVGLDCDTGFPLWRYEIAHAPANISGCSRTPLIATIAGRKNVLIWGYDGVMGLDLFTGQRLWHWDIGGGGGDMVSSVVCDGQRLYCCATGLIAALDLEALGGMEDPLIWQGSRGGPNISSPVLCHEFLLFVTDHGIVTCLDSKTGKRHWRKRLPGEYYASPVAIGDCVYFCNKAGMTTVINVGPTFEVAVRNEYREQTLASFASTQHGLFLRTDNHVMLIDDKGIDDRILRNR